jgi:hypothetical protein
MNQTIVGGNRRNHTEWLDKHAMPMIDLHFMIFLEFIQLIGFCCLIILHLQTIVNDKLLDNWLNCSCKPFHLGVVVVVIVW